MNDLKINTIDVHELQKRRNADPALCLIDVREMDEWQTGHIPGALHIPKDKLTTTIAAKGIDTQQPIYLHCKGGVRSLNAAYALAEKGFIEVYSVEGGIIAWEKSGYPIEK